MKNEHCDLATTNAYIYSSWLVVEPYPSEKNMKVSWDYSSQCMEHKKCSKPPTRLYPIYVEDCEKNMETKTYFVGYFGSRNFRVFPFQLLHRKFHNSLSCSSNPSTCSPVSPAVQLHGQKMWFPGCLPHLYLHWMEMDQKNN